MLGFGHGCYTLLLTSLPAVPRCIIMLMILEYTSITHKAKGIVPHCICSSTDGDCSLILVQVGEQLELPTLLGYRSTLCKIYMYMCKVHMCVCVHECAWRSRNTS